MKDLLNFKKRIHSFKNKKIVASGFTLVEIILAVTILGILAAVTLSIINQQFQRERARDAVRRSQVEQLTLAIESFFAAEGRYPSEINGVPNDSLLSRYVSSWPADLQYRVDATNFQAFAIYSQQSDDNYIKYSTTWDTIEECLPDNISDITVCNSASGPPLPIVTGLVVIPSSATISIGGKVQLKAEAIYSSGPNVDVTNDVGTNWIEGNVPGLAIIDVNNTTNKGEVTGLLAGTQTADVSYGGFNAFSTITVSATPPPPPGPPGPPAPPAPPSPPVLKSIDLLPSTTTMTPGSIFGFTLWAKYDSGPDIDITNDNTVLWTLNQSIPAKVSYIGGGQVRAARVGTAVINVSYQGQTDFSNIVVN